MDNCENKIFMFIHRLLILFLMIFFAFGVVFSQGAKNVINFVFNAWKYSYLLPFIWLYVILGIIMIGIYKRIKNMEPKKIIVIIFIMAFIPRVIVALLSTYIPTSDFANYFSFGKLFLERDFETIKQICNNYSIPTFGGLAVLNGLIASIFSPTIFGFQLANCILTSLITVIIYLFGSRYKNNIGIIAAFLYAFYPSSIISTQIITNQHASTLFYLIAIYLLTICLEEKEKSKILSVVAALLFIGGYFFHPSAITHIIAIIIYAILIMINFRDNKKTIRKIIKDLVTFGISAMLIYIVSMKLLRGYGIIEKIPEEISMLSKIVVGLNQETKGQYSEEDYAEMIGRPKEEQTKIALELIQERIEDKKALSKLFLEKIDFMWYQGDSMFYWYKMGEQLAVADNQSVESIRNYENRTKIIDSYAQLDVIYCFIVYLMALLGLTLSKNKIGIEKIYLLFWVLSGWIGVHVFIEIQSRYRYFAMPIIFILGAIGISELRNNLKGLWERLQVKN